MSLLAICSMEESLIVVVWIVTRAFSIILTLVYSFAFLTVLSIALTYLSILIFTAFSITLPGVIISIANSSTLILSLSHSITTSSTQLSFTSNSNYSHHQDQLLSTFPSL